MLANLKRLWGATAHAYHEWRSAISQSYREQRARRRGEGFSWGRAPGVIRIRPTDLSQSEDDAEHVARQPGLRYLAQSNLWDGGTGGSEPRFAVAESLRLVAGAIEEGIELEGDQMWISLTLVPPEDLNVPSGPTPPPKAER